MLERSIVKHTKASASILLLLAFASPSTMARQDVVPPVKAEGDKAAPPEAAPAPADNPEARMILDACAQAIKKARAITYQGHYHVVGGMLEGYMGTQTGSVKLLRAPAPDAAPGPQDPFIALIVGTDVSGKKVELPIEVALRHSSIEWKDDEAKKVLERPSRDMQSRNKITQASTFLRNEEFLKPEPLADFASATVTLDGTDTQDGVVCDVVTISRGKSKTERWSIATTDHLPRRIAIIPAGDNGQLVFELTGVTVDNSDTPALTPGQLRVSVPAGYEEDRRLAPVPKPTPPAATTPPSGTPSTKPENHSTKPAHAAPVPPPEPPKPKVAPEFELSIGRGKNGESTSGKVKLADLHGSVIVLDFFGTWTISAPEWHTELDGLAKSDAYKDVKFLTLDVREKVPEAAIAYMDHEKHVPMLLMNADKVAKDYGVRVYPATVVIGTDGKIVELVQGSRAGGESKNLVKAAIDKALGATPTSDKAPTEKSSEEPGTKQDPAAEPK